MSLAKLEQTAKPIMTTSGAIYPFSERLKRKFTLKTRYGDEFKLYKEVGEGHNHAIWLPRQVCPIGDQDRRVHGVSFKVKSNFKARSNDQEHFVAGITKLLKAGESHIAQAPTGFGKTVCCAEVIARIGVKTLIIVPKDDITKQWRDALKMIGFAEDDIGMIQANTCVVINKKVVIAMVHSVCKVGRYPSWVYKEFGLIVVDETHVMGADTFSDAMWLFPAALRLGVSATPYRKDGKDIVFFAHIGQIRVKAHTMALKPKVIIQETSWKVPIIAVADKESGEKKLQKMPIQAGKTQRINKMLATHDDRNAQIVRFVMTAYKKGRSIIVFSDLKEFHLDRLYALLRQAGVPTKDLTYYVGGMKEEEREAAKIKPILLATYQMAAMATDIPWLDTCVLATPRSDVVQTVGRILREYEGKISVERDGMEKGVVPVVYDLVDADSPLFKGYADKREGWYLSIKSRIVKIGGGEHGSAKEGQG